MLRLRQRFPVLTFGFLLTLSAASAVFIHQVSPLRDPAFYSKPLTGGSPLPWLQGVHEHTWLLGVSILAALLAISLTLVLRQWSLAQILPSGSQSQNTSSRKISSFLFSTPGITIGIAICIGLFLWLMGHYGFVFFGMGGRVIVLIVALLAIHFTSIFWLRHQSESPNTSTLWHQRVPRKIAQPLLFAYWIVTAVIFFMGFELLFVFYLLAQWIID